MNDLLGALVAGATATVLTNIVHYLRGHTRTRDIPALSSEAAVTLRRCVLSRDNAEERALLNIQEAEVWHARFIECESRLAVSEDRLNRRATALTCVVALETPTPNATVRRMAATARAGLLV